MSLRKTQQTQLFASSLWQCKSNLNTHFLSTSKQQMYLPLLYVSVRCKVQYKNIHKKLKFKGKLKI